MFKFWMKALARNTYLDNGRLKRIVRGEMVRMEREDGDVEDNKSQRWSDVAE